MDNKPGIDTHVVVDVSPAKAPVGAALEAAGRPKLERDGAAVEAA